MIIDTIAAPPVLKSIFHQGDFSVDSVRTIRDGLNLHWIRNYDAIVLLQHPEADSRTDCERIRHTTDSPLIVISNNASTETCLEAIQAGADYFLRKSFGPLELIARVKSLLSRVPSRTTRTSRTSQPSPTLSSVR